MHRSTRAVLLSALVFPGAGQLYLKRYIPAAGLISIALACLFILFSRTLEQAQQISDKILNAELPLETQAVAELISQQLTAGELQQLNMASVGFLGCWIVSIVDAYTAGRRQR